jgi:hypothetical protein
MYKSSPVKKDKQVVSPLAKVVDTPAIVSEKSFAKNYTLFTNGIIRDTKDSKYKISNDHVFVSYGKGNRTGNFYFSQDSNILNNICHNPYYFKRYAFVEIKTEYYKLMFDFDFKSNNYGYVQYKDDSVKIVDFIVENINKVLLESFVKPNIDFIYCDKSTGHGAHVYYPNIIVNKEIHQEIYNRTFNTLGQSQKFKLTTKQWRDIFDSCVSIANGLRLPYFCVNGSFYKQNSKKSTYDVPEYDGKPNPKMLYLCCVRTDKTKVEPETTIILSEKTNIVETKCKTAETIKTVKTINLANPEKESFRHEDGTKYELTFKVQPHINKVSVNDLDKKLECLDKERFLKYNDWRALKYIVFNCNNSVEACKIFHKHCRVGEYKNISYEEIESQFMKTPKCKNFNTSVLTSYARRDNPDLFNQCKFEMTYDAPKFDTIKFNLEKLTKLKGAKKNTIIENNMELFLSDSKKKALCIVSYYNTGKTTLVKSTITKFPNIFKRCLFITHRKTLANDIEKNFTDMGFISYLNKEDFSPSEDKIIVNMDSLKCLYEDINFFTGQAILRKYDVIILDEFASLLNSFESTLMGSARNEIHEIFNKLIMDTPKIICADGDFSNREYEYLSDSLNKREIDVYENEFRPPPYKIIFTKDGNNFLDEIESCLKKGKKLVITSMSSKKALEWEKYFSNGGYNVLCITGYCDAQTKKKLVNPKELFYNGGKEIQLFIYSPILTVGVNIDFSYFDKQFGYMCSGSVNARDYTQMLYRIRQFVESNIMILLDSSISTKKQANFYSIDEVTNILCIELRKKRDELTTFEKLRIWNYWEDINSKHYLFQVFVYLLKKKNHSYIIKPEVERDAEYNKNLKEKNQQRGVEKGGVKKDIIENIVKAKNITGTELSRLIKKQNNDEITSGESYCIEKYTYAKKFNIKMSDITTEFMETVYEKSYIVDNYESLMMKTSDDQIVKCSNEGHIEEIKKLIKSLDLKDDDSNKMKRDKIDKIKKLAKDLGFDINDDQIKYIRTNNKIENSEKTDLSAEIKKKKIHYVKNIIAALGFKLEDGQIVDIKIDNKTLENNMKKVNAIITNEFRLLFKMSRSSDELMDSNKKFLGSVNKIIGVYGVKVRVFRTSTMVDGKKCNKCYYILKDTSVIEVYKREKEKRRNEIEKMCEGYT